MRPVCVGARLDPRIVDGRPALARSEPIEQAIAQPRALGFEPGIGPKVAVLSRILGQREELRAKPFPVDVFPVALADHVGAALATPR